MCSAKTPKMPAASPVAAPMQDVTTQMDNSENVAARQQALRRGMASVWTRFGETEGAAGAGGEGTAEKLGG